MALNWKLSAVIGLLVVFSLALTCESSNCVEVEPTDVAIPDIGQSLKHCGLPSAFFGQMLQIGRSNKTRRYYFTIKTELYASQLEPNDITSMADVRLLNTFPQIAWNSTSPNFGWTADLFLINEMYTHPDADTDHLGYTTPHPLVPNYFYSLLVTSTHVWNASEPIFLRSESAARYEGRQVPGTLNAFAAVYDPYWNISWWISSNYAPSAPTVTYGGDPSISWVNHATGAINQYIDPGLGWAPMIGQMVYLESRQLIAYVNGSRIYLTPRSNHAFGPIKFQPGLMNYMNIPGLIALSLLHIPESDSLLVGCSLGLVVEINLSSLTVVTISRLGLKPSGQELVGEDLATVAWLKRDPTHPNNIFFGLSHPPGGGFYAMGRFYLNERTRYSIIANAGLSVTYTASGRNAPYIPGRTLVFNDDHSYIYAPGSGMQRDVRASARPTDSDQAQWERLSPVVFFALNISDCSVRTDCLSCYEDRDYCGWCPSTGTCARSALSCPAGDWTRDYVCPISTIATPSIVPAEGGTNATFFGLAFKTGLSCIFNPTSPFSVPSPATLLTESSVTCNIPPAPATMTGVTEPLIVQMRDGFSDWGSPYTLTYVKCPAITSCDSCVAQPGCGWCLGTNRCSYSTLCPSSDVWSLQCPELRSLSPSSVSAQGGQLLSLTATQVLVDASYSYELELDHSKRAPATLKAGSTIASASFTSTMPLLTSVTGSGHTNVTLIRNPGGAVVASSDKLLNVYDCPSFTRCFTCFAAGPRCNWCSSTSSCVDSTATTGCSTSSTSCAAATSVSPRNVYLNDPVPTLTITGVNFNTLPTANLKCVFSSEFGTQTTAATIVSATSATCPGVASPQAIYELSLGYSESPAFQPIQFEVYTCDGAPCSTCVSPGKETRCRWCNDFSSPAFGCDLTGTACTAPVSDVSLCPSLTSATPNPVLEDVVTPVKLQGSFGSLPISDSQCVFTPPTDSGLDNVVVDVSAAATTTVDCQSTTLGLMGEWDVSVHHANLSYTAPINVHVFSCGIATTCGECVVNDLCGWSHAGCVAKTATSIVDVANCPVISNVIPNVALVAGGDAVTVLGGPFEAGTGLYVCKFEGNPLVSNSSTSTSSTVICPVPMSINTMASTLDLYTMSSPSHRYSNTSTPLSFTYVDCPVITTSLCSSACVSYPDANGNPLNGCGFCSATGQCTVKGRCSDLWVPQCFKSVDLWPKFALLDGKDTLSIAVDTPPELPGTINARREALVASDFECSFGTTSTMGTLVTDAQTGAGKVECPTPVVNGPSTTTFNINYRTRRFTDFITFSFADCSSQTDCTSCLSRAPCGWCMDTQECTTPTRCPLGNYTSTSCPDLRALIPSTGSVKGGEKVQLVGSLFIPSPGLSVHFGDQVIQPKFVSSTSLEITTPRRKSAGEVSVEVWDGSAKYAATAQLFTYNKDNRNNVIGIAVGLSLGLFFLLLIVIIIAIILYRRKSKGLVFNIKEPDYQLVAFGTHTELIYRMPPDNYQFLETVLGRYNFALQVAMAVVSPPTEEDLIAKSMLYVAQSRGQSVGMINALVKGEIARCREENTIFRSNSVASKSFKFYSRVVGIPYLWKCMARVIYELEILGNRSAKEQEESTDTGSTSLLRMTMEVDMERYAGESGGPADIDAEVNSLQLKLTCQKLFSVLVKNGVSDIPAEFRQIFVEIDSQIMEKFNNDMAVYKAIGGFFFLRFVCPAITAPHYYGLLDRPPNETTQRQLVLISKVIQSLANMQMPGRKETYMESMSDFIEKNMGTVVKFYQDMREASRVDIGANAAMEVPDNVRLNALAAIWEFCHTYQAKLQPEFEAIEDATDREALMGDFKSLLEEYPQKPKKSGDTGSTKAPRSSRKKRNTRSEK